MTNEDTVETYTRDWSHYVRSDILAPESVLLDEYRERWAQSAVLDLGVGAGRTTWFFAPLAKKYVGVDVVAKMIEHCKVFFGEDERRSFQVGDAANLSAFADASFDVVMFSYNGIDHLDFDGRAQSLAEIRRVLKPGGLFYFSSHSLEVFPYRPQYGHPGGRNPLRWIRHYRAAWDERRFFKSVNVTASSDEVRQRGWVELPDRGHSGPFSLFYVRPVVQMEMLKEAGFEVTRVVNSQGKDVTNLEKPGACWWYSYFCRKP